MAQSSGTSIVGLQRLGSFASTGTGWEVRFASTPDLGRVTRVGTLLHCVPISNSRFPVIRAHKLFTAGVRPPLESIPTYAGTEIWVQWFQGGLDWFFSRPD